MSRVHRDRASRPSMTGRARQVYTRKSVALVTRCRIFSSRSRPRRRSPRPVMNGRFATVLLASGSVLVEARELVSDAIADERNRRSVSHQDRRVAARPGKCSRFSVHRVAAGASRSDLRELMPCVSGPGVEQLTDDQLVVLLAARVPCALTRLRDFFEARALHSRCSSVHGAQLLEEARPRRCSSVSMAMMTWSSLPELLAELHRRSGESGRRRLRKLSVDVSNSQLGKLASDRRHRGHDARESQ